MPVQWIYLVCLVALCGALFYLFYPRVENFFVFFPQRSLEFSPQALGLPYKDVTFESGDGKRLHGWYFASRQEGPVILFCHGNAGNISHRLDNVSRLLGKGLRVFIFDYRGYGKSEGRPSEKGIYADGLAAYDYLLHREGISADEIVPFGRSLGGAVAVEVALGRRVKALVLESAFTSMRDMAKTMPLFLPISPFVPDHYNNLEKVSRVKVPLLVIHGDADELIPFSMGERLYAAAGAPKFFYPIRGAGHNDTYVVGGEGYFRNFATFAGHGRI
ncbi:MAG: alpha/beta hydrolase [Deltaproteobacteria bacterium]|nr:alpha/beta hydrolase [Deltaproteobacteria bacterium]